MADEPQTQTPPQGDPAPSNPPTPNPTPPPTDPTPTDPPPAGDPQDVEGYRRALEASRAEAKEAKREASSYKRAKEDAEAKVKAEEDAKKSAEERATARAEAAEKALAERDARLRSQAVKHAALSALRDLNFRNPDIAVRLLDLDTIEFDDDGEPKGVPEMVAALAKDNDWLITPKTAVSGPPATPRANGNGGPTADELAEAKRRFSIHSHSRV